ncbi:hypothetical protein ACFL4W_00945, partial [Planctomycetota bacterium]
MSTRTTAIRKKILKCLARGVDKAIEEFDPKSGRFLAPNGGWGVTMQDKMYSLAVLHTAPESPYHKNKNILNMALRAGDAVRDWQDPQGRVEFIKPDGSRWGMTYMCWTQYHWVETYGLLKDIMDKPRAKRWEKGLTLAFNGTAAQINHDKSTHNIPTWHGMALVRASQIFGRKDWFKAGKAQIMRTAATQSPQGYWSETGPTTRYNLVYVHSLGLYYYFTKDKAVLTHLKRAIDFHTTFTYPDGAPVETIDGRVKYHAGVAPMGIVGFTVTPAGRAYAAFLAGKFSQSSKGSCAPHLAALYAHFPEGEWAPIPQEQENYKRLFHGNALVLKKGPWFACLSGYTPDLDPIHESRVRWHMDRTHLISLYHQKAGLIVGGGNSKHHPQFCTFEYWKNNGLHLQPDKIKVGARGTGKAVLKAFYGRDICELVIDLKDNNQAAISVRRMDKNSKASVRGGFVMKLKPGTYLSKKKDTWKPKINPLESLDFSMRKGNDPDIMARDWTLTMPVGSSFSWPVYPFNPYAIDDSASPDQAVAALSIPLKGAKKESFIITINGKKKKKKNSRP